MYSFDYSSDYWAPSLLYCDVIREMMMMIAQDVFPALEKKHSSRYNFVFFFGFCTFCLHLFIKGKKQNRTEYCIFHSDYLWENTALYTIHSVMMQRQGPHKYDININMKNKAILFYLQNIFQTNKKKHRRMTPLPFSFYCSYISTIKYNRK